MGGTHEYVMLICSLPTHPENLFKASITTISRQGLDKRLKLLKPRHAEDLARVEEVVHWNRLPMGLSDEEFLQRADDLFSKVESPFVRDLVKFRLEVRSLTAALRRRHLGMDAPTDNQVWGSERWLPAIHRNWRLPDFGLVQAVPWIGTANQLLEAGDSAGLQRLLMEVNWNHYRQVAAGHLFDFEAVVIYVLRWDMIDRWTRYNGQAAEARFQQLVDEGLGRFRAVLN